MLFVIFGWRGVTTTPDRGSFFCPSCSAEREYGHKVVRRFFTLYFIPIIPLDRVGEYVECGACKGTFKPEVLEWDPLKQQREFEAEFEKAIRRVMVRMMLADGDVDPAEVEPIRDVFERLTGTPCPADTIRSEAKSAMGEQRSLTEVVGGVAPMLNEHGKEMVVRAAILVAGADGRFEAEETALLHAIGEQLELPESKVAAMLEPVRQGMLEEVA